MLRLRMALYGDVDSVGAPLTLTLNFTLTFTLTLTLYGDVDIVGAPLTLTFPLPST